MANIRVDVNYTIADGNEIVFRSPVDCSEITGLIVYYPTVDGNTTSKVFALADAHGNNVGDIDHLFAENVAVKVIMDVAAGMAFVQNADTNAYLEGRFEEVGAGVELVDSDLSNMFTYTKVTDVTALLNIEGGVKNTGTDYSSTAFKRSDYIHLHKGCTITGKKIRTSSLAAIAVYSEEKVFDSENSVIGSSATTNYTLTMPYDGFVRLCCRVNELDAGGTYTIVNGLGERFYTIENNVGVLNCVASTIGKYTVNENAIKENANAYIAEASNGELLATTDAVGCSNLRVCIPGDKLKYKLSINTNWIFFATYDKNLNLLSYVKGTGQSKFTEGEHTFADNEVYFRIAGVLTYINRCYAEYIPVHDYKIGVEMEDVEDAIENALTADVLPDYYADHIAERIAVINEKDCMIGSHGDSFVFITDTHLERNKMNSPALIKEIIGNTAVRFVINGGDTLDNDPTQEQALERFRQWRKLMHGVEEYRAKGNHDLNGSGQSVTEAVLTEDQWYGTMVKPIEGLVNTNGKPYFCVDNQSQKIRYVCLGAPYSAAEQRAWLKERLTELEAGWTVLVIPHYLFDTEVGVLHTHGSYLIADINEVYSGMNATLIGILAGHTHADYSTTEETNGYLLIATTCDALTGTPAKVSGTVTEQAFDVIHIDTKNRKLYATRIGAGDDREWSY